MSNIITWKLIENSLEKGIEVMLLYVLESSGSSPGRQGFFMAVTVTGAMEGSIGGGIMEHKFVEMAKEKLKVQEYRKQEIRKQVHDKSVAKDQSGMICSGEQSILFYRVQSADALTVRKIIHSLEQNKNGQLRLSPAGINFSTDIPDQDFFFEIHSEGDWRYTEKTGYKNQLHIVGGGHCSLALSKLMREMDFYIIVYDERSDLKTMADNDFAHEKKIVKTYSDLNKLIPPGNHQYIVLMTFGYRSDDQALRSVFKKELGYLGMLGSSHKIQKMFDDYRKEGIPETILQRIHAPIGLLIKSQTPQEIAVSIAAEIIQHKNK